MFLCATGVGPLRLVAVQVFLISIVKMGLVAMVRVFAYKVRDQAGKPIAGQIEAEGRTAAVTALRKQNYIIIDIWEKVEAGMEIKAGSPMARKVGVKELSIYCRQFSTMVEAGVPLINCLYILCRQAENRRLKAANESIIRELQRGSTLAESLSKRPDVFPDIFVNLVEAGETGGILDQALERLAEHFEKEYELREKIKAAVTYPAFVLAVSVLVVGILLIVVMPNFLSVLQDLKVALPLSTRIVLSISSLTRHYWYLVLGFTLAAIILANRLKATRYKRAQLDGMILSIPVFGILLKKIIISRFCRTLSALIRSGVPILTALEVVKKTSGNTLVEKALVQVQEAIRDGHGIAETLGKSSFFPPMVTRMIAVGEQTGSLDRLLEKAAVFYEKEVEFSTVRLSSVLEPVLMLCTGAIVGFVVISIMLPMFDMITSIR